ncbi:MAG: cytochrome C [Desulfobacterales bacterium PC51MH44]|nr:MAG: cytochrome C [Desulfobacterales bacterium PC51MH44]
MRSKTVVVLIVFGLLFSVAMASEVQNRGASDITLDGGKKGNVNFPHHMHQDNIKDCQVCHDLFPQKLGIIQDLKNQGKLKKKQVMNNKCLKCHKAKKKAGEEAGPTKCTECHIK